MGKCGLLHIAAHTHSGASVNEWKTYSVMHEGCYNYFPLITEIMMCKPTNEEGLLYNKTVQFIDVHAVLNSASVVISAEC